jgi:hypothetical protein
MGVNLACGSNMISVKMKLKIEIKKVENKYKKILMVLAKKNWVKYGRYRLQ